MSEQFLSEVTLEYLMNKEQYAKYISQNKPSVKSANKKDKKFYKKRIYDLTRQLINNEPKEELFPDIIYAFDNYVKMCIDYFKVLDKRDILQEEHDASQLEDDINGKNDKIVTMEEQLESDKLIMRTFHIREPNSLEKLVKRKITRVREKPPIIPVQKEINLKDPLLKNKGIRKKNNINNKYEESSKDEKNKESK
uniref:Uncharacterized protein n=1 Tax=viral metagenome TaxID=1070528 RepID=A0A6C0AZG2_9ZZZZ